MLKDNNPENITSPEEPKKNKKLSRCSLNTLIYIVCFSVIGYVGITIAACNILIPGTIEYASSMGTLKNPPISACDKTQSEGFKTLLAVAGLLIAYRANSKD